MIGVRGYMYIFLYFLFHFYYETEASLRVRINKKRFYILVILILLFSYIIHTLYNTRIPKPLVSMPPSSPSYHYNSIQTPYSRRINTFFHHHHHHPRLLPFLLIFLLYINFVIFRFSFLLFLHFSLYFSLCPRTNIIHHISTLYFFFISFCSSYFKPLPAYYYELCQIIFITTSSSTLFLYFPRKTGYQMLF